MIVPNFNYELEIWNNGFPTVAGVDEVGRGCLAGPVVAGCVAFKQNPNLESQIPKHIRIDDSKRLTVKQRESADLWIRENSSGFGIGKATVGEINKYGIVKATEIAFRMAIANCKLKIDYLLIDAFYIPFVKGLQRKNQKAIIKGDTLSVSIAAASIIAKVYRDNLMTKIPNIYGWEANKGYGTKIHREAIEKYGISNHHRTQFVRNFVSSQV